MTTAHELSVRARQRSTSNPQPASLGSGLGSGEQVGALEPAEQQVENARRAQRLIDVAGGESDSFLDQVKHGFGTALEVTGLDKALAFIDRGRKAVNLVAQDNLIASMFTTPYTTAPLLMSSMWKSLNDNKGQGWDTFTRAAGDIGDNLQADKQQGYEISGADYWDILMGRDEKVAARMEEAGGIEVPDALLGFNRDISYSSLLEQNTGFTQEWVNQLPMGLKQVAATGRFVAAFGGDVANDPVTYFTGGMGGLTRGAAQGVVKSAVRTSAKNVTGLITGATVNSADDALRVLSQDVGKKVARRSFSPLDRHAATDIIDRARALQLDDPKLLWDDAVEQAAGLKRDVQIRTKGRADNKTIEMVDDEFDFTPDGVYGQLQDNLAGHIETKYFDSADAGWRAWVETATSSDKVWTTGGIRFGLGYGSVALPGITPATRGLQRKVTRTLLTDRKTFKEFQRGASWQRTKGIWDKGRRRFSTDASYSMAAHPSYGTSYTAFVNAYDDAPARAIKALGLDTLGEIVEVQGRWSGIRQALKSTFGEGEALDQVTAKLMDDIGSGVTPTIPVSVPKDVGESILKFKTDVDTIYKAAGDALAAVDDDFKMMLDQTSHVYRPFSLTEDFAIVLGEMAENVRIHMGDLTSPKKIAEYAKRLKTADGEAIDAEALGQFLEIMHTLTNDIARLKPTGETAEFHMRKIGRTGLHMEGDAGVVSFAKLGTINDRMKEVLEAVVKEQGYDSKALRRLKKRGGNTVELDPAKQIERYVADVTEAVRQRVVIGEGERFNLAVQKGRILNRSTALSMLVAKDESGSSLLQRLNTFEADLKREATSEEILQLALEVDKTRVQLGSSGEWVSVPNELMADPKFVAIVDELQAVWGRAVDTAEQFPHQYAKELKRIRAEFKALGRPATDNEIHSLTVSRVLKGLQQAEAEYFAEVGAVLREAATQRAGVSAVLGVEAAVQMEDFTAYLAQQTRAVDTLIDDYRNAYVKIFTDELDKASIDPVEMAQIQTVANDIRTAGERHVTVQIDSADQAARRSKERLQQAITDSADEAQLRELRFAADIDRTYADALRYKLQGVNAPSHGVANMTIPDFGYMVGPDTPPSVVAAIEAVTGAIEGADSQVQVTRLTHERGYGVTTTQRRDVLMKADSKLFFYSPVWADDGNETFRLLSHAVSGEPINSRVSSTMVQEWWDREMHAIAPNVFVPVNGTPGVIVVTGVPSNSTDSLQFINAIQSELRGMFYAKGTGLGTNLAVEAPRAIRAAGHIPLVKDLQVTRIHLSNDVIAATPGMTPEHRTQLILQYNDQKLETRQIGQASIVSEEIDEGLERVRRRAEQGREFEYSPTEPTPAQKRKARQAARIAQKQREEEYAQGFGFTYDEVLETWVWTGEFSDKAQYDATRPVGTADQLAPSREGPVGKSPEQVAAARAERKARERPGSISEAVEDFAPIMAMDDATIDSLDALVPRRLSDIENPEFPEFQGQFTETVDSEVIDAGDFAAPSAEADLARRQAEGYQLPDVGEELVGATPSSQAQVQRLLDARESSRQAYELRIPVNKRRLQVAQERFVAPKRATGELDPEKGALFAPNAPVDAAGAPLERQAFRETDEYLRLKALTVPYEETDEFKDYARRIRQAKQEREDVSSVAVSEAGGKNVGFQEGDRLDEVAFASQTQPPAGATYIDSVARYVRNILEEDGSLPAEQIDEIVEMYIRGLSDSIRTEPVSLSSIVASMKREQIQAMRVQLPWRGPTDSTELYFPSGTKLDIPETAAQVQWVESIEKVRVRRRGQRPVGTGDDARTEFFEEFRTSSVRTERGTQTPITGEKLDPSVQIETQVVDEQFPPVGKATLERTPIERQTGEQLVDKNLEEMANLPNLDEVAEGVTVADEVAALEGDPVVSGGFADDFEEIPIREAPTYEARAQDYYEGIQSSDRYARKDVQGQPVDTNDYWETYNVEADLLETIGATFSRIFSKQRSPEDLMADPFVVRRVDDLLRGINATQVSARSAEGVAAMAEHGVNWTSVRRKMGRLRAGDLTVIEDPEVVKFVAISNDIHMFQTQPDEWLAMHPGRDLPTGLTKAEKRYPTTTGFAMNNRRSTDQRVNVGRGGSSGGVDNGYFGNPHTTQSAGSTQKAVELYDADIRARAATDPVYSDRVRDLQGKKLVCPGSPQSHDGGVCHAQPLARLADELAAQPPKTSTPPYKYQPENASYEVSSNGDSQYSALTAKLSDGRTIEDHYQIDFKGYDTRSGGKNSLPKPRTVGADYVPDEATATDMLNAAHKWRTGKHPRSVSKVQANEYADNLEAVARRREVSNAVPSLEEAEAMLVRARNLRRNSGSTVKEQLVTLRKAMDLEEAASRRPEKRFALGAEAELRKQKRRASAERGPVLEADQTTIDRILRQSEERRALLGDEDQVAPSGGVLDDIPENVPEPRGVLDDIPENTIGPNNLGIPEDTLIVENVPIERDFSDFTVAQLKAEARSRGLRGFSKLNKADLRARIEADAQPQLISPPSTPTPPDPVEALEATLTKVMWTEGQTADAYTQLWRQWADENPGAMQALADRAQGRPLTDQFAGKNTVSSQAEALQTILDENAITPTKPVIVSGEPGPPAPTQTGWGITNEDVFHAVETIQENTALAHEQMSTHLFSKTDQMVLDSQKQQTGALVEVMDAIAAIRNIDAVDDLSTEIQAVTDLIGAKKSELIAAVKQVWGNDAEVMVSTAKGIPSLTVTFPKSDQVAIDAAGGFDEALNALDDGIMSVQEAYSFDMPQVAKAHEALEALRNTKRPTTPRQVAEAENIESFFRDVMGEVQSAIERQNPTQLRRLVTTRRGHKGDYVLSKNMKALLESLDHAPAQQLFVMRYIETAWLADADWGPKDIAFQRYWQQERGLVGSLNMNPDAAANALERVMHQVGNFDGNNVLTTNELDDLQNMLSELTSALYRVDNKLARPSTQAVEDGVTPFAPGVAAELEPDRLRSGFNYQTPHQRDADLRLLEEVEIIKRRIEGIVTSQSYQKLRGAAKDAELDSIQAGLRHVEDLKKLFKDPMLYQETSVAGKQVFPELDTGITAGLALDPVFGDFLASTIKASKSVYTPYALSEISRIGRSMMNWWKAAATVSKPSFHIRNIIGGVSNGYIAGVHGSNYKAVISDVVTFRKQLKKLELGQLGSDAGVFERDVIGALSIENQEMFRRAWDEKILQTSFTRAEQLYDPTMSATWKPWDKNFAAFKWGGRTMESLEDVMRMAAFHRHFDSGAADLAVEAAKARNIVNAVHFDYTNLTDLERGIKNVMPFYVWTRRNVPLQLRVLTQNPSFLNWFNKAKSNWNEQQLQGMEDVSPFTRYQASQGLIMPYQRGNDAEWARLIWSPQLPGYDLDNLPIFESGVLPIGMSALNPGAWMAYGVDNLGPAISTAFGQQQAYEEGGDVNAPAGLNFVLNVLDALPVIDMNDKPDPNVGFAPDRDIRISKGVGRFVDTVVPFYQDYRAMLGIVPNNPYRASGEGWLPSDDPSGLADIPIRAALGTVGRVAGRGAGFSWATPTGAYFSGVDVEKELTKREIDTRLDAGAATESVDGPAMTYAEWVQAGGG